MSERLNSPEVNQVPEIPHDEWYGVQELPEYGYFFGSKRYQGTYHSRLQVNLPQVEQVCRFLDIAPISLKSESWQPPSVEEPETVGFGLAALKRFKNPFAKPNEEDDESQDKDKYKIGFSHYILDGDLTACTYDIKIRDRMIDYHLGQKYPNDDRAQQEERFVKEFNSTFWSALHSINKFEEIGARAGSKDWRRMINTIGYIASIGVTSIAGIPLREADTVVKFLSEQAVRGGSRLGVGALRDQYYYKKFPVEVDGESFDIHARTPARALADIWRISVDPERYKSEKQETPMLARTASRLAPYGLLFEDEYVYGLVRAASINKPFFRLK